MMRRCIKVRKCAECVDSPGKKRRNMTFNEWLDGQRIDGGSHGFECIGHARMAQVWDAAQHDLRQKLAAANDEIKDINAALNDPRVDLIMTASEAITEMRSAAHTLRDLLKSASGSMSYGHWSTEFRTRVETALKDWVPK